MPDWNIALAIVLAGGALLVGVPLLLMVFPGWDVVRQWFGFR